MGTRTQILPPWGFHRLSEREIASADATDSGSIDDRGFSQLLGVRLADHSPPLNWMTRESLASSSSCHWDRPQGPVIVIVVAADRPVFAAATTTTISDPNSPPPLVSPVVTEGTGAAAESLSWIHSDVSGNVGKNRSDVIGRGEGGRRSKKEEKKKEKKEGCCNNVRRGTKKTTTRTKPWISLCLPNRQQ